MTHCAPVGQRFTQNISCLSVRKLRGAMKALRRITDDPEVASMLQPYCKGHRTKAGLYNTLHDVLGLPEELWSETDLDPRLKVFSAAKLNLSDAFLPILADDTDVHRPFENVLLQSLHIDTAIRQHTCRRRLFAFAGTWAPNATCAHGGNATTKRLIRRGRSYIGIVWNTSGHSGGHWVAGWADRRSQTIDYFDSYGHTPSPSVEAAWNNWVGLFPKFKTRYSQINHQQNDTTQCGMYVIWWILERVKGHDMNDIHLTPPNVMQTLRYEYFRPLPDALVSMYKGHERVALQSIMH